MATLSPNFNFLPKRDRLLVELATLAERYFRDDPNTCLLKLRQFGEVMAQRAAAHAGVFLADEAQVDLLRRLQDRGVIGRQAAGLLHELRRTGNVANHELRGGRNEALHQLKMAHQLAGWYFRSFHQARGFELPPYQPPPEPADASDELQTEMAKLQAQLEEYRRVAAEARDAVEEQRRRRESAEYRALQQADEAATWQQLAEDAEARLAQEQPQEVAALEAEAEQKPEQVQAIIEQALTADADISLDEAATRTRIDKQLQDAGWEANSQLLKYSRGTRPAKGRNLAIAEWPTESGPADYALFIGLELYGIVEAKRDAKSCLAAIEQSKRYSRTYVVKGDDKPVGGPWGDYKVPFLFATNGRPFLRQLIEQSGIWYLDARRPQNHPVALEGWYSPEGLKAELRKDVDEAERRLAEESMDYLGLRDYQTTAIRKVEEALSDGQREMLLAMATGTGKTRTAIALVYRLCKFRRLRRVLFLVDRTALGDQAAGAFKEMHLDGVRTFAQIFDIKELGETQPEPDTRLHIATVQSMVKRVLYPGDDAPPAVDTYDGIVVDECHRGYLLDRELSDAEFSFRDEADYVSKYRRVLDHFDAVKVGLTATPALHTTEIFGEPVYQYGYREAVVDGWLIDHEPPIGIVTKLAQSGISWAKGEEVQTFEPSTGQLDLVHMPDEVNVEVEEFNKAVLTENFNRAVCEELANYLNPFEDEKTIIYCVRDTHADTVVRVLTEELEKAFGPIDDNTVLKITGNADKPLQLIRRFKNEKMPNVAVTVDLLTTGIDVPKICNLVFIRRVRSRILYEQMMGRATRLCPEIGKERFRIFDAVDLYAAMLSHSDMKPIVVNPTVTFEQLVDEIAAVKDETVRRELINQFVAKLRRKAPKMREAVLEAFGVASGGLDPGEVCDLLTDSDVETAAKWLQEHKSLALLLDRATGKPQKLYVSTHSDEVEQVTRGYGSGKKPEDYLDSFAKFLRDNLNKIPALMVVTQRPRELTRQQLKELKLKLDEEGYTEKSLQVAWHEAKNEDIAASIIGFIRQQALGEPLVRYEERVKRALKRILSSQPWKPAQRQWLERIGKQMAQETVVDKETLNRGGFERHGGFQRMNKIFDGRLEEVLGELHEAVWEEAG